MLSVCALSSLVCNFMRYSYFHRLVAVWFLVVNIRPAYSINHNGDNMFGLTRTKNLPQYTPLLLTINSINIDHEII